MRRAITLFAVAVALLSACATATRGGLERIERIVIIYAENRSFDHLYGLFPGAEGIAQATPEHAAHFAILLGPSPFHNPTPL